MPRVSQDDLTGKDAAPAKEPVKCGRPGCPNVFIPYRSTHKFCSPKCKSTVAVYKFALNGGR